MKEQYRYAINIPAVPNDQQPKLMQKLLKATGTHHLLRVTIEGGRRPYPRGLNIFIECDGQFSNENINALIAVILKFCPGAVAAHEDGLIEGMPLHYHQQRKQERQLEQAREAVLNELRQESKDLSAAVAVLEKRTEPELPF